MVTDRVSKDSHELISCASEDQDIKKNSTTSQLTPRNVNMNSSQRNLGCGEDVPSQ